MDDEAQESIKISRYNAAVAQLYRLDDLWKKSHDYCLAGLLPRWNWVLDRVWCELAADATKEERETFKSFLKKVTDSKHESEKLYLTLMDKEIFLRGVQNRQGKGSAYLDEDEDMFE